MSFEQEPIDALSAERLAADGLRLALVDRGDRASVDAWYQADSRGFHGASHTEKELDELAESTVPRRNTGVWDARTADPVTPVATVSSWPTALSIPGERSIVMWAIASVTVAPTHRRRGIARALLESELRTAAKLGVPIAGLTVSEATIYSRYGFGPATLTADLDIDARRVHWRGPRPDGRIQFIPLDRLRDEGRNIYDRARAGTPGEIELDNELWGRNLSLFGDTRDEAKRLRAIRYDDASGQSQGYAIYKVTGGEYDFTQHTAQVRQLIAVTDDAYAALWRFLIELDLVIAVSAPLRSIDEPVFWQIGDHRAARTSRRAEHLWLRILDVKAALGGRHYRAPGRLVFEIDDPLGFADGTVLMQVDESGRASVEPLSGDAPTDAAVLSLGVDQLGSLYLGGISAETLKRAGHLREGRPGSAAAADVILGSPVTPWLSTWF